MCILIDNEVDKDSLIKSILRSIQTFTVKLHTEFTQIKVRKSEFTKFLNKYGIAYHVLFESNASPISVVASSDYHTNGRYLTANNEVVVGFTIRKGKGLVTVLPFYIEFEAFEEEVEEILKELSKALETH